ncbi:MAG: SDR family NAD(P)-dependent oxidoreductase [Candidatus Sericytochromatia bacterium]|nr:SDR family NAD(P)-dependent oxidoreductase [Candidatus Sericytochromatia bacterium]
MADQDLSPDDLEICLRVLQHLADTRTVFPREHRLSALVAKVYREAKKHDTRTEKREKVDADRALKATTSMVQIQRDAKHANLALPSAQPASTRRLHEPETCYVCKQPFVDLHAFYHLLCPDCAAFNFEMRELHADLAGRTALVTGGRVKIGHEMVLRLLRDGARVLVVTRFPHAAAKRLHAEADSGAWLHRLEIFGLDLRNLPAVEAFAQHLLDTEPHLDILVHNAAQTIRRPAGFYRELAAQEAQPALAVPEAARRLVRMEAPQALVQTLAAGEPDLPQTGVAVAGATDVLPADRLHDNEERADSRDRNSWLLRLDEVGAPEMLEVQLVNQIAPFVLNARLRPLLTRSPHPRRFIVNVSAMEGQFSRHKTIYHPHTNMAKAALNMMTRTSGEDFARDGIYMTSVDTGWVTDENPAPKRERGQAERGFFPPLDIIDGMARIYHPVAFGLNRPETPYFGVFLKDYSPCPW